METARKFKIIVNSKECGTCSGSSPSAVAKNVVKKLCEKSNKVVKFSLKECKRGCERVCGPYQGRMEKLDRPYTRSGKKITHRVVCGKVRKMRGGRELVDEDFEKREGDGKFKFDKIGLRPHIFFGEEINVNGKEYYSLVVFNIEHTGEEKQCEFNELKKENNTISIVPIIGKKNNTQQQSEENKDNLLLLLEHLLYCKKLTDYKTIRKKLLDLLKDADFNGESLYTKLNIPIDLFERDYLPEVMTADVKRVSSDFYMKLPKKNDFELRESDYYSVKTYGAELNSEADIQKSVFKKPNFLKKVGYELYRDKDKYMIFSNKKDSKYYNLAIFSRNDTYIGIYNHNKRIVKFYPIDIKHFSRLTYPSNFIELVSILFPFRYLGNTHELQLKLLYFYQKYISTKIKMKSMSPYTNTQEEINSIEKRRYYIYPILSNYMYENPELTINDVDELSNEQINKMFPELKNIKLNDFDIIYIKDNLKQLIKLNSVFTTYLNVKKNGIDSLSNSDIQSQIDELNNIGYTFGKKEIIKGLKIKQNQKQKRILYIKSVSEYLNKTPDLKYIENVDKLTNIQINDIFPKSNNNSGKNKNIHYLKDIPYLRKLLKDEILKESIFIDYLNTNPFLTIDDIDKKEISSELIEKLKKINITDTEYIKSKLKELIKRRDYERDNYLTPVAIKYFTDNPHLTGYHVNRLKESNIDDIFPKNNLKRKIIKSDIHYIKTQLNMMIKNKLNDIAKTYFNRHPNIKLNNIKLNNINLENIKLENEEKNFVSRKLYRLISLKSSAKKYFDDKNLNDNDVKKLQELNKDTICQELKLEIKSNSIEKSDIEFIIYQLQMMIKKRNNNGQQRNNNATTTGNNATTQQQRATTQQQQRNNNNATTSNNK